MNVNVFGGKTIEIMYLLNGKWDNVDLCIWYIKWVVIFFFFWGDGNGGGVFANGNLKKKNETGFLAFLYKACLFGKWIKGSVKL